MAYWLDEAWHRWTQVDEVGTAAAGLYSRCGSYIADEETDGFIPTARARMYGTPEWIQRLVDAGLWTIDEKGFWDTRYLELNPTREQNERRKQGARDRQARYVAQLKRKPRKSRNSDASVDASATRVPIPPPSGERGAGTRGRPAPHDYQPDGYECSRCSLPEQHPVHQIRAVEAS